MPLNKEAILRYQLIDDCICNKHKPFPSMEEIIDYCCEHMGKRFSVSTIQKDIKDMKEDELLGYLAPIKFSKSSNGYYYDNPDYTIRNVPLNNDEIEALEFAAGILEQYKGSKVGETFNAAVEKVLTSLKVKRLEQKKATQEIVQQEFAPYTKGYEKIDPLIHCIINKIPISFVHYSYRRLKFSSITLHPYLLKEYRNRWYVVGFSESHKNIRIFGLDRMEDIYSLNKTFYKVPKFDAKKLFQNVIGVFIKNTNEIETIKLQFSDFIANYIKSQPIHPSQQIIEHKEHGSIIISIDVCPTYELISLILSYGKDVQVLEPKWLRLEIINELESSLAKLKQTSKILQR